MRILFLHEVNYETKPIFEMHEFPEHLAQRGHEVGFVQFPEGLKKEQLRTMPWRKEVSGRVVEGANISLFTPKSLSGGLIGRLEMTISFASEFRKVVKEFKPGVILSLAVPTSGWQALRVAKKLKVPFVFRALDVSHKIRRSIFSPLIWLSERFIYKNADWVSANNPAMLDYCLSMGAQELQASVELPPLDLEHFKKSSSLSPSVLREKYGIPKDAMVALYMGSFFYFSGLPELIKSFESDRQDNEYLVLVGGGEQDTELRQQVMASDASDFIRFTGFVGFDELPVHLAMADVAVNPMHRSKVSNIAFPNKVLQYMAAGLPVVSTDLRGLRATFGDTAGLVFVDSSNDVYSQVQKMFKDAELAAIGKSNSSSISQTFGVDSAVTALEARLKTLVEG